ncbi:polyprenyl synthetase family protein [Bacillus luteolus]|uniref:Polyprenyl synthetase family protein n=2 Tax=Litchfieldia luteola TaxID=682179 RepID=A0ABR9QG14_9BACI|nr:polyprenyl synthetase family protein [Cytobacillus luteolus]
MKEMMNLLEVDNLHQQFKFLVKECLNSKRNFIFGELAILHYRIFKGKDKFINNNKIAAIVELFIMCYEMIDNLRDKKQMNIPVFNSIVVNNEVGLMVLCNNWITSIPMPEKNRVKVKRAILNHFLNYSSGKPLKNVHSEKDYIESVRLKSGKLTSLASVIGSLCGTTDEKDLTTVRKYSEQIGVISQINKDLENILRTDDENDLLNWPSRTLPIHYLSQGQNQESQDVMSAIKLGEVYVEQKLPQLVEKVKCSGVTDYIKIVHKFHQLIALSYLVELNIDESDRRLIEDYIPAP